MREDDWPQPTASELAAASEPRYFAPDPNAVLALTIEKANIYGAPVLDSEAEGDLDKGVIHLPQTPMPWEEREHKNVYLAAHRVGNQGTVGRMLFFNLDGLREGDRVTLEDRSGGAYEYRVSEVFQVEPDAEWVIDPVRDRDMLTLQTCTYPDPKNRVVVRADRA